MFAESNISIVRLWHALVDGDPAAWVILIAVPTLLIGAILLDNWRHRRRDIGSKQPPKEGPEA